MTPVVHPYASAAYAAAFAPRETVALPAARTHVILRPIDGSEAVDAMGCYPVCVFDGHDGLGADLASLATRGVVSLVLVTDCLTQPEAAFLERHFDCVRPFKTHYVYDRTQPDTDYSKHHRDRVRLARRSCQTRVIDLASHLDAWCACYDTLVARHGITGIQAFGRSYFEAVSRMPDVTTIGAFEGDVLVSAHIWMRFGTFVYAHLAASTDRGYKLRSAFAIYDHAVQLFGGECVIDFGGGAGTASSEDDGLAAFKRGFANGERRNFLCGRVLDRAVYDQLSRGREADDYFPAYRRAL